MPGCTKRYTDPSSLRKHVKNHSVPRNKKKSRTDDILIQPKMSQSLSVPLTPGMSEKYTPFEPADVIAKSVQNDFMDHIESNKMYPGVCGKNTMNLVEMSKCILSMENEEHDYSFNLEKIPANKFSNCDIDLMNGEEFVSIENIKKYLGEQNMDYIDVTLQKHLNTDYFGGFYQNLQ